MATLLWFRRDLRLADNPALTATLEYDKPVIPVYIHETGDANPWPPGAASSWWLHHSLASLDQDLHALGSRLVIRSGDDPCEVLQALADETGATRVCWNRQYEPHATARDKRIKSALRDASVDVESFNAGLLFEPWQISKQDGGPYRVFTPFWKACVRRGLPDSLLPAPDHMPAVDTELAGESLASLQLLPKIPCDRQFPDCWQPGETGAGIKLDEFIAHAVDGYAEQRDIPAHAGTSMLSPHLHFGEISPRRIVHIMQQLMHRSAVAGISSHAESYLREIGWREFACHLLYHFPHTTNAPLDPRFEQFEWRQDDAALRAWQQGRTGIPIVDAGMRQLWATGWMHNRVRMLVASLLVKNLRIHWLEGARWFWDTLVDADLASNTLGWQWVAGCGADAAPYFRIFNPVTQAHKFDADGNYVRHWVPELDNDTATGNYPPAIVDLKTSRVQALAAYQSMRTS